MGFNIAALSSGVDEISPDTVREDMLRSPGGDVELIDVREPAEYERGHLPGAKLIPLSGLADRINEIDTSKKVVTY